MQSLLLLLIPITMTSEYLEKIKLAPHGISYLQEILGACVLLYVAIVGGKERFQYVRVAYWVAFGFVVLIMICGIAANAVAPGPVFAGMRTYLRAIPLFFLAATFPFTEAQIRTQLRLLLGLCLLQVPIAISQRMATAARGGFTGDYTSGTMLISSILSIFLVCAACVLTGLYLRKRMPLRTYVPLIFLILLPTAINETKATLLILPVGLLITFILGSPRRTRARNGVLAISVLTILLSAFVSIYDYMVRDKPGVVGLVDFFTEGRVEKYLDKNAGLGADSTEVGRVDAIVVSSDFIARDPVWMAFGVGVGNASDSALGDQFRGKYFRLFYAYFWLGVVRIGVETGLFGLLGVFFLMYLIFKDAKFIADNDTGLTSSIAVGWMGVVVVIGIGMFYKDLIITPGIPFLFWYFSGLIAARRSRMAFGTS